MKSVILLASLALATVAAAAGSTYLEETFSDANWEKRWVASEAKPDLGKFELSSGSFYADKEINQGLKTVDDSKFYSISTPLSEVVDNSDKDLIVQYSVKQETPIECGGTYVKLLPQGYDAAKFDGESEYSIMFGPDVCGKTNKIHIILNYNGKNYLTKKEFPVVTDTKTHLYRLTIHPDQKYSLNVDAELMVEKAPLSEHWEIYAPKQIPDVTDVKPKDWVDDEQIVDESFKKPAGFDDIKQFIADPDAVRPDDWDTDADGDWEAPEILNPDWEEWSPRLMANPDYKGAWEPRKVDNPEYKEDANLAHYKIAGLGLDLWQVKSGSIFDDIVVTSDVDVADKYTFAWKETNQKEKNILAEKEQAETLARLKQQEDEEQENQRKEREQQKVVGDELDEEDEVAPKVVEPVVEKVAQEATAVEGEEEGAQELQFDEVVDDSVEEVFDEDDEAEEADIQFGNAANQDSNVAHDEL